MIGLVPAAGAATRWNGYPKFMLPMPDGRWLIDRAVDALEKVASSIVVVARQVHVEILSDHLEVHHRTPINFVSERYHDPDLMGAIRAAMPAIRGSHVAMAMADTVINPETFAQMPGAALTLGTFETSDPSRYGVVFKQMVLDKRPWKAGVVMRAWGVAAWWPEVTELWEQEGVTKFERALNRAIVRFGMRTWPIGEYRDMASWADYIRWAREQQP